MKRIILLLLINLLTITTSFSQITWIPNVEDSIIVLTPTQLKQTNLIFNEHSKLLKENSILKNEISNYEKLNTNWTRIDSINKAEISIYKKNINRNKIKDKLKNVLIIILAITSGIFIIK